MLAPLLLSLLTTPTAPALYQESRAAYQEGRFQDAAELLERAYALDPAPTLLYNLARARESAGDTTAARLAYERYLRADPEAKDQRAIEKRIEVLQAQERAEAMVVEPPVIAQTTVDSTRVSPYPWVAAGAGGALVLTGSLLGALASNRQGDARAAQIHADAIALRSQAESYATGANVMFAVGGTVLAAGVVWGIVDLVSIDPDVVPVVSKDGVSISGQF